MVIPESRLRLLETLTKWWEAHAKLASLLCHTELPGTSELSELAWLRPFDRADLDEFVRELHDALIATSADNDTTVLDECVDAWRTTARQLEDPLRRSVLLVSHHPDDYVEVGEPNDDG